MIETLPATVKTPLVKIDDTC